MRTSLSSEMPVKRGTSANFPACLKPNSFSRALALILSVGLILPSATSCKKKKKDDSSSDNNASVRAEYVQESDPYYSDTTIQFELPADKVKSDREVASIEPAGCAFGEDTIVIGYHAELKLTPEEQEEMDTCDYGTPSGLKRYYELQHSSSESGVMIFSMNGEYLHTSSSELFESMESFEVLKSGRIAIFTGAFDPETEGHSSKIVIVDKEGNREREIPLDEMYGIRPQELDDGSLILVSSKPKKVFIVDKNGKITSSKEYKYEEHGLFEIDGKYYLLTQDTKVTEDSFETHNYLYEINTATAELGSPKEVANNLPYRFYESGGKYYAEDQGLVRYDILNGTSESVFRPESLGITFSCSDIHVASDTDIDILNTVTEGTAELATRKISLIRLHKEEKNPHAGKRIVYVGACSDLTHFQSLVTAYNKRPESKAFVIAYTENPGNIVNFKKVEASAADRLLLDMKSGTGPDVLLNCADYGQFNSEQILVDLNPYMDGANGIDRTKYYDNIFRAFEADGKLYQMPIAVQVLGFNGDRKVLGDIDGWTLSEFETKIDALGDSVYPAIGGFMSETNVHEQEGLLTGFLYSDMSHYVDYSKGEVRFDSDDFRKVLELSKKYGSRISSDKLASLYEEYDNMTSNQRTESLMMQDGVCALSTMWFSNLESFSDFGNLCNNDPLYLGWPTSGGGGLTAEAVYSVGISAFSNCKDEAWDFVSFLLLSETQLLVSDSPRSILLNKESEELDMKKCIEEYQKKAEQNPSYSPVDEETAKHYEEVIGKIRSSMHTNPAIMEIVLEEARAYFSGSQDLTTVSKTIQNRVSTLLSEAK